MRSEDSAHRATVLVSLFMGISVLAVPSFSVSANSPPWISVPDYTDVVRGVPYLFSVTASDPDPDPLMFTWDWGDGKVSVTTTDSAIHTYVLYGSYVLTVWADDSTGITNPPHNVSDTGRIGFYPGLNHLPVMTTSGFTASNATPWTGEVVTFCATPTDIDGDILDITFDFGDGTDSVTLTQSDPNTTLTVTHRYLTEGTFFPYVTFTDWITPPVTRYSTDMIPPWYVTTHGSYFDLDLEWGWNFVSLPLVGYGYMASLLPLNHGDMVVGYDWVAQEYDQVYFVDFELDDFELEDSCGYWIYSNVARAITIFGDLPTTLQSRYIDVPNTGGWATFGFTGLNGTRWASDMEGMFTGTIDLVVEWDPAIQGFSNTYFAAWNEGDFQLSPGKAYWVYFEMDGTLTYTP